MLEKFGYDIRRAHYSSLILTNQLKKNEAINKLKKKPYNRDTLNQDFNYISTKLGFSVDELKNLMVGKNKTYEDYKNNKKLIDLGIFLMRLFGGENKKIR